MRYVLLTARHDRTASPARLLAANRARLAAPGRWTPEASWRDWFYRVAWQERPVDAALALGRAALRAIAPEAAAADRLARAYLGAADVASVTPAPAMVRLHAHLLTLQASAEDPDTLPVPGIPEATLLLRCGPRLRAVLEGKADPLDALFGDGGLAAEALYADSPCARAVNAIAAAALDEALAGRPAATVLEIGCGTGGTTAALLPRLRPGDRYIATDVSPGFVAALRRRLDIDGGTLDIELPPESQGYARGSADVVVAANVLHATRSLRATLEHAAALLAPDGHLLLVENSGSLAWGDLTFGLTAGMWAFGDTDLRPSHALLPPARWVSLLRDAGFEAAFYQPNDEQTAMLSGQFVLLARRKSVDRIWTAPNTGDAVALLGAALDQVRAAVSEPVPPRLWLVTRNARATEPGKAADPVQATLWGMANSVAIEHPELRLTMVDADDPGAVPALVATGSAETRLAVRAGRVFRARLQRAAPPVAPAGIRADATYLVTGGLAGVGLAVARWLVARGGRSVALAGRTPHLLDGFPPGATVTGHACDVADEAALSGLLAALARGRPPLRGIFHAAGVLDDAVLAQQTPGRTAAVLRPKLAGALLLDRLTRDLPLDHFVLFSSSAALLGSAAQANHAAANAALDALAEGRHAAGLPALSINWGAWAEIGAAARAGEGVARRGLLPMQPDAALDALGHAMAGSDAVIGVLDVDWPVFLDRFPPGCRPPLFEAMVKADAVTRRDLPATQAAPPRSLRAELQAAARADRAAGLLARVQAIVARILGLPADSLPPPLAPLRELGLDSLMTVELRNALAAACETRLPATLVFEHPTCAALATHLGATVFAELVPLEAVAGDGLDALDADALARLLEDELGAADAQLADSP
jgi:SAM-dependent methyltransferase/acyl carrier protein